MNYFEFYGLPISFVVDQTELKKKFFLKSREFHPDFHVNATEDEKQHVLQQSSLNNLAYKTLQNQESTIKYILELEGIISDDQKEELPQEFLFEMMDLNEEVEEQISLGKKEALDAILMKINNIHSDLKQGVKLILNSNYPDIGQDQLYEVQAYYFKSKYLKRIKENLL